MPLPLFARILTDSLVGKHLAKFSTRDGKYSKSASWTERGGAAVNLRNRFRENLGSNAGTAVLSSISRGFPKSLLANAGTKREIREKTSRLAASSGTIPTRKNFGVTRPGIESLSHRGPRVTGVKVKGQGHLHPTWWTRWLPGTGMTEHEQLRAPVPGPDGAKLTFLFYVQTVLVNPQRPDLSPDQPPPPPTLVCHRNDTCVVIPGAAALINHWMFERNPALVTETIGGALGTRVCQVLVKAEALPPPTLHLFKEDRLLPDLKQTIRSPLRPLPRLACVSLDLEDELWLGLFPTFPEFPHSRAEQSALNINTCVLKIGSVMEEPGKAAVTFRLCFFPPTTCRPPSDIAQSVLSSRKQLAYNLTPRWLTSSLEEGDRLGLWEDILPTPRFGAKSQYFRHSSAIFTAVAHNCPASSASSAPNGQVEEWMGRSVGEKILLLSAFSVTLLTCNIPAFDPLAIQPGSPRWEASAVCPFYEMTGLRSFYFLHVDPPFVSLSSYHSRYRQQHDQRQCRQNMAAVELLQQVRFLPLFFSTEFKIVALDGPLCTSLPGDEAMRFIALWDMNGETAVYITSSDAPASEMASLIGNVSQRGSPMGARDYQYRDHRLDSYAETKWGGGSFEVAYTFLNKLREALGTGRASNWLLGVARVGYRASIGDRRSDALLDVCNKVSWVLGERLEPESAWLRADLLLSCMNRLLIHPVPNLINVANKPMNEYDARGVAAGRKIRVVLTCYLGGSMAQGGGELVLFGDIGRSIPLEGGGGREGERERERERERGEKGDGNNYLVTKGMRSIFRGDNYSKHYPYHDTCLVYCACLYSENEYKVYQLGSPLVDDRPIMSAVKYRVVSGVVWTNRTMAHNALKLFVVTTCGCNVRMLARPVRPLEQNKAKPIKTPDPTEKKEEATLHIHLDRSPPTKVNQVQSWPGRFRIFASWNRAGRCAADRRVLSGIPPPPWRSGAAPFSHDSTLIGSLDLVGCLRHLSTLTWPARSPDVSPIEHLWDEMRLQHPLGRNGAVVAERLVCSPPTKPNWAQSPAGPLPDFRKWESCRMMSRCSKSFPGDLSFPPPLHSGDAPSSPLFTLIGSQDLVIFHQNCPDAESGFAIVHLTFIDVSAMCDKVRFFAVKLDLSGEPLWHSLSIPELSERPSTSEELDR
ncbi:hypothetical protein PR048_022211 [Dryococelus australis]|uniref:Uncharacterized protein n=1 Tax=Dryococelus australis TaxID=614101 RepID=A0ABQ9H0D1_9NEOP|nr:hypothetical protein PR048_022211 [Dryococelus australis]